jgi:pimeloyl-ACP methyl ester carboxylesterase
VSRRQARPVRDDLTMSGTHETARTEFVLVGGHRIAYRRFGRDAGEPLLLLNYFAANMDDWDPAITNGFAADRETILCDLPGVGQSTGKTPPTVAELAKNVVQLFRSLDLRSVDVIGFSLGGMIAQRIAVDHPELIRRLILLGTGPRGGEQMTFAELRIDELDDPAALIMKAFFTPSEGSQAAGRAYLARLGLRNRERDTPVSKESAAAQLDAIREWGRVPAQDRYSDLPRICQPTLIVHGQKDVVVAPVNAFTMQQLIPNAQLLMFPDASHGAHSQHAKFFLPHARLFLNS